MFGSEWPGSSIALTSAVVEEVMHRVSVSLCVLVLAGAFGLCFLSGCPGPEPQAANADGGATCTCPEGDVLFVVDNTTSMSGHDDDLYLAAWLARDAIQQLLDRACSLHVGVVTATPQTKNPPACQELGDLSRVNNESQPCELQNGRYLTEEDDPETFPALFFCLLSTGLPASDGNERPIEALFAALDPARNAAGGCNEGFLREEAPLLVVIISDVDDNLSDLDGVGGPDEPDDWFDELEQLKGDIELIAMIGIIGPTADPSCGAQPGERLRGFIENNLPSHQAVLNICNPGGEQLKDAIESNVDQLCPEAG